MREAVLRDLAAAGGGLYAHADDDGDVAAIRDAISAPPPPVPIPGEEAPPAWSRYDLPFLLGIAALVLVLLESLLDASLPRLLPARPREAA
jgi:hypothetical protein